MVNDPENEPWGDVVIVCGKVMLSPPKVMRVTLALVGKLEPLKAMLVQVVPVFGLSDNMDIP